MLSCKKVVENTSEYLDGNLSFSQKLKVKLHLFMCVHCRRYIRQIKQTIQMIGGSQKKQVPSETEKELMQEYQKVMDK